METFIPFISSVINDALLETTPDTIINRYFSLSTQGKRHIFYNKPLLQFIDAR